MNNEASENVKSENLTPNTNARVYYSPRKIGLFVGIPSFFIVSFISFGGSFCGGILSSIGIGAVAGWVTAHYSNIGSWANASEFGGKAGRMAGLFVLFGHIVGGLLPALLLRMGSLVGVLPSNETTAFADLNSAFLRQGLINGIIGLIVSWISASAIAPKVYEKVQNEDRT